MLLEDAIKEFTYEIQTRNYSPRTIKTYRNSILRYAEYVLKVYQVVELEDTAPMHIKGYLNSLKDKGRTSVYLNTILKNLRSFYGYCFKEGYTLDISKKVIFLKEKKTVIKTFTNKEVKGMLDYYDFSSYLNARNKVIMAILFDTGIRCLELCKLSRSDVRESVIYITGKGDKQRVVPISPYLKKLMIKYERIRDSYLKDDILHYNNYFLSSRNKPLTVEAVERVVKKASIGAKVREEIRCSPHTCRHYFAQSQLKNGNDVYSTSRLLGHETIEITKRYLQGLKDADVVEKSIKTSPLMNLKV